MNSKSTIFKSISFVLLVLVCMGKGVSQSETSKIKAQIVIGINSPESNGFVTTFSGKSVNFPTVNLGLQYMLKPRLGIKLDYGFNRISNDKNSAEFKLNYSRINFQAVYDASRILSFSNRMGVFIHAGPGISIIRPLGNYGNNDNSFFNILGGVEWHFGISDNLSVFLDTSYIKGLSEDFNPISSGFGSYNGNLVTIAFGVSVSLSGCYFCGKR